MVDNSQTGSSNSVIGTGEGGGRSRESNYLTREGTRTGVRSSVEDLSPFYTFRCRRSEGLSGERAGELV